jgi:hypothetical protein
VVAILERQRIPRRHNMLDADAIAESARLTRAAGPWRVSPNASVSPRARFTTVSSRLGIPRRRWVPISGRGRRDQPRAVTERILGGRTATGPRCSGRAFANTASPSSQSRASFCRGWEGPPRVVVPRDQ